MQKIQRKILTGALASIATAYSLQAAATDLDIKKFALSDVAPSPACLSAAANGDVYVGVDLLGSLGKGAGKGRIMKLVDTNNDGIADKHTVFAELDNPRGLIAMGDKLYVLHTNIPADTNVMEGMYLSVLTDKDRDGVADGPAKTLIKKISTLKHNQERGADHTTNGIHMGIDGWIYIAVGDFGFVDAEGTDGTKLTQLGGGVLRVRPDGSEMEVYTHGLRNIYDVAIDPFMNIFTRGNTNDGGGWWIRFIDQIQTAEYGYPVLFKHFTDEIIPALCDLGSGSGAGALFMDEPSWPAKYNKQPMMADWGHSHIYIHRLTADSPSFTQKVENFIATPQPADLDVDASGRLFVAAWDGAGYKGNPSRGHIQQITPKGWKYKAFPNLKKLSTAALIKGLKSDSAKTRLSIQQALLNRPAKSIKLKSILEIAQDNTNSLESRVAAIFTYAQLAQAAGTEELVALSKDKSVREWALRAITDRSKLAKNAPLEPFYAGLADSDKRVQVAALVGLNRIGKDAAAEKVIKLAKTEPRQFNLEPEPSEPIFESEVITGKNSAEINIKLDGTGTLVLIADPAGADSSDHAGWFDPTLTINGKSIKLTEQKWRSADQGWGKTLINKSCTGATLNRMDGKSFSSGIGTHAKSTIIYDIPEEFKDAQFTATAAICSTGAASSSIKFIVGSAGILSEEKSVGPHATPNSDIVVPHIAVHTLVSLNAIETCLAALDGPSQDGAIWALRLMHDQKTIDGLITKLSSTSDEALKIKIMDALARLYSVEAPYDGSWWWNTQPETDGPYYVPTTWKGSEKIAKAYLAQLAKATPQAAALYKQIAVKNKAFIPGLNDQIIDPNTKVVKVGEMSIEDIILAFENSTADTKNGKKILLNKSCIACHSMEAEHAKKGPDLEHIGSILNREEIAAAIIQPAATIAKNWVDVKTKSGAVHNGTLVSKDATTVVVRNIAGMETKVPATDVTSIAPAAFTLMGPHLLDTLTIQEFIDAVEYLAAKK